VPRALRIGNFGVYVCCERGERHHLPHAHIKHRGQRVASIFLMTMTVYDDQMPLPRTLLSAMREAQEDLLELWEELNEDD
jgi:hypothetical protein